MKTTAFFTLKIMSAELTITAIEPQKRNKNRVNIFLNGEFAFGLSTAAANELKIGRKLIEEDIQQLQGLEELNKTKEIAINLLSYRPRSREEIRAHLRKKGIDDSVIEQAVEDLIENNLLNDLDFASYWVEQREEFKPRGKYALRYELLQKGVDQTTIETVLEQINEHDSAIRAGRRKAIQLVGLNQAQYIQKLSQYLERRGFSYEIISDVTGDFWTETSEDNIEKISFSRGE